MTDACARPEGRSATLRRPVDSRLRRRPPACRTSVLRRMLRLGRPGTRVPVEILGGLDGDAPARDLITAQDSEVAQKSGRPAREIASLTRSPLPTPKVGV